MTRDQWEADLLSYRQARKMARIVIVFVTLVSWITEILITVYHAYLIDHAPKGTRMIIALISLYLMVFRGFSLVRRIVACKLLIKESQETVRNGIFAEKRLLLARTLFGTCDALYLSVVAGIERKNQLESILIGGALFFVTVIVRNFCKSI
uniref:Uncharacterized protein n=1 Tax=Caenorhabditis japonica TaxID=281687 RepID=A0A8R1I7R7_CAEJA